MVKGGLPCGAGVVDGCGGWMVGAGGGYVAGG